MNASRRTFGRAFCLGLAIVPLLAAGCGSQSRSSSENKPTVAYVTNGIASFWVVAEAGVRAAERDFDVTALVKMPPADGRIANQKRMIEELLTLGVDGIAVSPIDPKNQKDILDAIAQSCHYITQDSDAPETNRLAYVGMSNYDAGRLCGELVREALPSGGGVMLFIGSLDQDNAKLRRQGLIDELLDRSHDPSRYDPPDQPVTGPKYTVVGTRTDNFDFGAAKSLAEDALAAYPDLDCMVGMFAYNPPAILEAIKGADKLGEVKLIGFDEDEVTLQAIVDGHCFGTVVQDPYRYGYESIRILAGLARGDNSVIPEGGFLNIPARKITQQNVTPFWDHLKQLMAGQKSSESQASGRQQPQPGSLTSNSSLPKVRIAFVTNNASDFWKIAQAGVRQGEEEFRADCEIFLPPNGTADDQQRFIEAKIAQGIAGMAISPNDAENQVPIINQAAEYMPVICHDSDAPKSKRLAYVGTNNYKAGQEAGKLIKQVLPGGGKIMLFVGKMDAQNAIDRSGGIRDELAGSGIEILDIRTDDTDRARAKQNVEDTITRYPDIGCLVGLWSYNGPAIYEAVKEAGRAGELPIVCFDEEEATLAGVLQGDIYATVVQQPYEFGYQSVRILTFLARGQDAGIPASKVIEIPVRVIQQRNVQPFWDNLKKIKSAG
jgi:ribose transport system substrate-binding protein